MKTYAITISIHLEAENQQEADSVAGLIEKDIYEKRDVHDIFLDNVEEVI